MKYKKIKMKFNFKKTYLGKYNLMYLECIPIRYNK